MSCCLNAIIIVILSISDPAIAGEIGTGDVLVDLDGTVSGDSGFQVGRS